MKNILGGMSIVTVLILGGLAYLVWSNMKAEKKLKAINETTNGNAEATANGANS